MTDHDLRTLLRDQVADVTTTADLSAGVWRTSRGARRRRSVGVIAGSAAATVLVFGGIAIVDSQPNDPPGLAPAPAVDTTPDAHFRGAPVYWSPSQPDEADLPLMSEGRPPLPEVIDLSAEATPVEQDPIDRAVAAFAVMGDGRLDRLLLLVPGGDYRTLDVSEVEPHPLSSFGGAPAVSDAMLSGSGEYLMFPQLGHVDVYDLPDNEWRRIDTGAADTFRATWSRYGSGDNSQLFLPEADENHGPLFDVETGANEGVSRQGVSATPRRLEPSYPFGRELFGPAGLLQSWGSGADLPVPDARTRPEFLVASGDSTTILTFTGSPGGDDRWLQCCPVVGWAGDGVAMYESRSRTPRIIAWTVGTHTFETVSTIAGFRPGEQSYVASYAELWR